MQNTVMHASSRNSLKERGAKRTGAKWFLYWLPPLAWGAGIFLLSSIPGDDLPTTAWMGPLDKLVHAILFGTLALWLFRALRFSIAAPARTLVVAVFILTVLYGVSDEYHQSYVPGRSMDWADGLADAIGAVCVLAFFAREKQMNHE